MRIVLNKGEELLGEIYGQKIIVGDLTRRGGQGEIYTATMDGQRCAVKWYYPKTIADDPNLRQRLQVTAKRSPPNSSFVWPIDLVVPAKQFGLFGYVMPWREDRFCDFKDIIVMHKVNPSYRALTTAGIETAVAYKALHGAGFSYQDINFGNVAMDPATGEARICDNDNVDVNHAAKNSVGTPGFMAPEIVQHLCGATTNTDMWSLAVLMFWAFVRNDPLLGRKEAEVSLWDEAAELTLYGSAPLFIFDPVDRSNEPVPGRHKNALRLWPVLPLFLQNLFIRAFTEGIRKPNRRVLETEWRSAMVKLRDLIRLCPNCTTENFYDADATTQLRCWSCGHDLPKPICLALADSMVVMAEGASLFPHHIVSDGRWDFSEPVARVLSDPAQPNIVGLQNLKDAPWRATTPDGHESSVERGRVLRLRPGLQIMFDRARGIVS